MAGASSHSRSVGLDFLDDIDTVTNPPPQKYVRP